MKELKFTKQGMTKKATGRSKAKAKSKISLNTIYNGDCLKTMSLMPDSFIDLTGARQIQLPRYI